MTPAEKVELTLIPLLALAGFLAAPMLPARVDLGTLLLAVFVLLLLQSLLRDLWLLARSRRAAASGPVRSVPCLCAESIVGAVGVVAGIVVLGAGIGQPVEIAGWGWALGAFVVTAAGFAIKDYVVAWRPFAIRREKDHLNIVVRWRS